MNASVLLHLLAGLTALVVGAQLLVRGASKLALALGTSPLVVGLTVVAFGTSAPELAVSAQSSLNGQGELILGNVIGSNIYNVLFILGVCSVITPLAVAPQLIRLDVPIMIGVAGLAFGLSLDRSLSRVDGMILVGGIVTYTLFVIRNARRDAQSVRDEYKEEITDAVKPDRRFWLHGLLIGAGLVLLTVGSDWLVEAAVAVARAFKLSEMLIGMTVVTLGTTAPELSACLVASYRGEKDLAVGNIVGSNIFNILGVLGLGAALSPDGIPVAPAVLNFGMPVMLGVSVACLPVFFAGQQIARWEGGLFLLHFSMYLTFLVLEALHHPYAQTLQTAALWFVLPLTVIMLGVSAYREWSQRGQKAI